MPATKINPAGSHHLTADCVWGNSPVVIAKDEGAGSFAEQWSQQFGKQRNPLGVIGQVTGQSNEVKIQRGTVIEHLPVEIGAWSSVEVQV